MSRFLGVALLAVVAALALAGPAPAQAPLTPLVINEVDYDQVGTDTAEFLEIRNNTASPINLDPYALSFRNGASGGSAQYLAVDLPAVSLAAGDHFVVCGDTATVPACDLDAGAATDLIQNGAPDAVALLNGSTIIDTVSYEGQVPGYTEGPAGAPTDTAAAPPAPPQSISRVPNGCDTDQNGADFKLVASTPGASNGEPSCSSGPPPPGDTPPAVTSTNPGNGAVQVDRDSNVTVTFNEPVTAGAGAFALTCDGNAVPFALSSNAGGTVFTLDPNERLPRDAQCTIAVESDAVSDQDSNDPPDRPLTDFTSTFRTDSAIEGLRIHDIQGRQHVSPFNNAIVAAVPGVVTAVRRNGYFIQDPQPDTDSRTSEGIFIFTGTGAVPPALTPGTAVNVTGQVGEFRAGFANLSTTQISRSTVVPSGTGSIDPTIVGRGGRVPPNEIVDNDTVDPGEEDPPTFGGNVEDKSRPAPAPQDPTFDPDEDGIDFYESLEGMLTEVRNAVAVGPTSDFGSNRELPVVADDGADANVRAARGPIVVRGFDTTPPQEYRRGDFNPERIILNDAQDPSGPVIPLADVRDHFSAPVRAVVDYNFGNFKFLVVNPPAITDGGLQPETTRSRGRSELAVASYNVENLDGLDPQPRFDRIAGQIVGNLKAPDILSLEEMQDNDGAPNQAPSTADVTHRRLIEAIVAAGGPRYDFRQIDPVPGADGGQPGGNIRVSFLFRTDRRDLDFVDRPGGNATTPTEPVAGQGQSARLTLSPGRVDPNNPVWDNSRKPLAGEFRYRGKPLFLVGNHFNSKGGDDPVFGRFQEPRRSSEVQRRGSATDPADTTRGQAGVVNRFVRSILDIDPRARVVVLGDINDFEFSETLRVLEEGPDSSSRELVNLWRLLPQSERYSYIFQGNAQVLDHILVSPALFEGGRPDFDAVHINAEFEDQASDHDPPITRLHMTGNDKDDDKGDRDGDDDRDDDRDDD